MLITSHIPPEPGIYIFKDLQGGVLYIGKAKNLHKRVQQYFTLGSVWKQDMVARADTIDYITVYNESEALFLEANLIKKHQPPFNSLLKDDSNFCFIKITKEDFPQILTTRKRINDGAVYIGPKHQTYVVKEFLQYLRQILQFRTSGASEFRKGTLNTDYYFGLDKGRSVIAKLNQKDAEKYRQEAIKHGLVLDRSYEAYREEYHDIIKKISSFFEGNIKPIEDDIRIKIQHAIDKQRFEWAAKLRDIYMHIDQLAEKQRVVMDLALTGFVGLMKQMSGWTVFVIFQLYEGKIVDIMKHKQKEDDLDVGAFIAGVENEYGTANWYRIQLQAASPSKGRVNGKQKIEPYTLRSACLPVGKAQGDNGILGGEMLFFIDANMKKIKQQSLTELQKLMEKSFDDFVVATSFEKESLMNDILKGLQERYTLTTFPYRVECIDISHLSGGWMSGGLSCVVGGIPLYKGYRRYKIRTVKTLDQQNNDYKALEEVLLRRFTKTDRSQKVDVFVIDGGKGQLAVVQKLLINNPQFANAVGDTQFISIGKGEARKRKGKNDGEKEKVYVLPNVTSSAVERSQRFLDSDSLHSKGQTYSFNISYDDVDKILLKARNEAHRFANAYRKKQMSKEWK